MLGRRKEYMKRTGFKKPSYDEFMAKLKAEPPKFKPQMKARAPKRAKQEREYNADIPAFLRAHPISPISGNRTTSVHHSARRWGKWLNLKYYWIAVDDTDHKWIEENGAEAEKLGLMVRVREDYETHVAKLLEQGVDLEAPLYYQSR